MEKINRSNSKHYTWGQGCDGWKLLETKDAGVIEELVPPGQSEIMHYHTSSKQFFYILEGKAAIKFEDETILLESGDSILIPPGVYHQFCNQSDESVKFLLFSFPKSEWDRIDMK